ncbi:MAG: carbohydrate-binding domain-containing protein [Bacteroidaceae bacterium]|nr:carbohydrate-binding domain-containing protein [Bacteroidaceae bacterium]
MKTLNQTILPMLAALTTLLAACSTDNVLDDITTPTSGGTASGSSSSTTSGLTTYTVGIDRTSAEPATTADEQFPDADEDPLENNTFGTEVSIDLSNPVAKTVNGVEVTVRDGHVTANHGTTKQVCYVLSGSTSNGSFTVVGEKKYEVRLEGVSITNPDSAALNLLCSKRAYIVLGEGTTNTLADGTTSQNAHKGTLYCKGKLLFNGSGSLSVTANYNNGIHSADYIVFRTGNNVYVKSAANHGIKANDGIYINGGILNVEVSAAAAKGINCESHVCVNGGRTTVITTGAGTYDTDEQEAKGAACIKADSTFTIRGGELWLKSTGSGGKGIKTDAESLFLGGSTYIITEGSQYKSYGDTASPKGVKADGALDIAGGLLWVRTSGTGSEGIESKSTLLISGGETASYAYDDAINAKSHLTISGGYVFAQGRNNDGIDANGNMYIQGGTVYAVSSGGAEVALDANTEGGYKLYVQGGTIVAVGGLEQGSSLSQSCYQGSWSSNTWYALTGGSGTFCFRTPSSGGSGLVISTPSTPGLTSGISVSGGTSYFGGLAATGASVSGGSSVSLSSYSGGMSGPGGKGGWR